MLKHHFQAVDLKLSSFLDKINVKYTFNKQIKLKSVNNFDHIRELMQ